MKIDTKKIANEILRLEIEHNDNCWSDNIAVMLCSFFEDSIYNPQDGEMDEYDCWSQWSVDQVNLIEKKIIEILDKHICI